MEDAQLLVTNWEKFIDFQGWNQETPFVLFEEPQALEKLLPIKFNKFQVANEPCNWRVIVDILGLETMNKIFSRNYFNNKRHQIHEQLT